MQPITNKSFYTHTNKLHINTLTVIKAGVLSAIKSNYKVMK